MNESYFEAITLVSLPMRENLRSWVAIGWKVKRKSSGQSQPRTYFCSNCGSRPLCLPWFSLVYTVGISWVFDSNDFQGYVVNANFRDNEVPRGWDQNLDWQVKMCYPFLVMMFLEWSCLKDQARYLCICEVFVSKEFAYYCDFGETTGIAEILRSLKRTHFVPIINDVFNRSFKNCSVACSSVESYQSVVQCSGSN